MSFPNGKYAWSVKVGEKGQFVIPKEAREVFGINPGDTLLVLGDINQGIAIPPKSAMQGIMQQIFGSDEEARKGADNECDKNN